MGKRRSFKDVDRCHKVVLFDIENQGKSDWI